MKFKPVRLLHGHKDEDGVWHDSNDLPVDELWCNKHRRTTWSLSPISFNALTRLMVMTIITTDEFKESVGGEKASRDEVAAKVKELSPLCCRLGDDFLFNARGKIVQAFNQIRRQAEHAQVRNRS